MRLRRFNSALWFWLVAAAMLVGIVSSTVAQTGGAFASQAPWAEVCTGSGASADADGGAPSLPAQAHRFGHCPICSLHGTLLALLPTRAPATALPALNFALPPAIAQAVPASHAWLAAQPRGPPGRG